jgi:hypothetical protein
MSSLDLDKQEELLAEKFDLADLADPAVREKLVTKFLALSDVLNPQANATSAAVSILQSSRIGAQFVPFTLNVDIVNFSAGLLLNRYR